MISRRNVLAAAASLCAVPAARAAEDVPLLEPGRSGFATTAMSEAADFIRLKIDGDQRRLLGILKRSAPEWTDGELELTVNWQPAQGPAASERNVTTSSLTLRPMGRAVGPQSLPRKPGSLYYRYLEDQVVTVDWEEQPDQSWMPRNTPHMTLDRRVHDRLMDAEIVTGLPLAEGYAVRVPFCDPEARLVETVTWRVTSRRNVYWPVLHEDKRVGWVVTETGPRGEATYFVDQQTRRLLGRSWTEGGSKVVEFLAPYNALR